MSGRPDPEPEERRTAVAAPAPGYRWALRPGWVASHLFVLACVALFVRLGFWQLSRLAERRAANALVETRQAAPPAPLGELVGAGPVDVDALVDRRVAATGTWRPDEQVLIRNETYEGAPGMWVVTPLVGADGRAVAVNRGWVPRAVAEGDPAAYAPPVGTVTVTGVLARSEERSTFGPTDPAEGRLPSLARVDVGRLARQVDEPLLPVYVTLRSQQPGGGELPVAVAPPVLDDGPHLNYAGQWFIFAGLTLVVYPLLLRRTARQRAAAAGEPAPAGEGEPAPAGEGEPAPAGEGEPAPARVGGVPPGPKAPVGDGSDGAGAAAGDDPAGADAGADAGGAVGDGSADGGPVADAGPGPAAPVPPPASAR